MTCPTPERLSRLLSESLAEDERGPLEDHVGGCPACQARLDELTHAPAADRWRGLLAPRAAPAPARDATLIERLARHGPAGTDRPASADAADWPGLPGYELVRELGRGGMGVVFLARQASLGRAVAVKVLRDRGDADALARFRAEAEAVARLQHPNIVPVYEVGECDGRPYLVLEYVVGGSLAERVAGTPQPPAPSAILVATLARAVQHAHERGVLHRDLKPANVLMAPNTDHPKIADFGLAKRLDLDPGLTRTGVILGTPSYMAPEQAAGGPVGPAADVYALGGVLYELLTGRPPFRGADPLETLVQVRHADPVPPDRFQLGLPTDLEAICLKCLAKQPTARYGSAAALADDLDRFLAGKPTLARPTSAVGRVWKWARRRPAAAALATVSTVAVLALGALAAGFAYDARLARANEALGAALAAERSAQDQAEAFRYFHEVALAHTEWRAHNVAQAEGFLDACRPDRRGWEWHYLKGLCAGHAWDVPAHRGAALAVACCPDGLRLLTTGRDGAARTWAVGAAKPLTDVPLAIGGAAAVSPDGRFAAAADADGVVRVWSAGAGPARSLVGGPVGVVRRLAFSADGRRLAAAAGPAVRLWDVPTGQPLGTLKSDAAAVTAVAFSPDGSKVAAAVTAPDRIDVWDVAAGRVERTLVGQYYQVNALAFHPGGSSLASAGADRTVRLWPLGPGAGPNPLTVRGHDDDILCIAFSPDGTRLASAGVDRTIRVWESASGQPLLTLTGHRDAVEAVAFSRGGRLLASAGRDGAVKLWDATAEPDCAVLPGHADTTSGVAFDADGGRLATGGGDRLVRVWDVAAGAAVATLRGHTEVIWAVAHHPRANRVASVDRAGGLIVWDVAAGRPLANATAHLPRARAVAFHPGGALVATAGHDGTVKVWDADTGRLVRSLTADPLGEAVTFSPDGVRLAATGQAGTVRIWNASTLELERTLPARGGPSRALAFHPSGRTLAVAGGRGSVTLWDAATGAEAATLGDHTSAAFGLAFSPDGTRLATAGGDGTVRVWDVGSGQRLLSLPAGGQANFAVAFSPDGTRLAAAGRGGLMRLWDGRPDDRHGSPARWAVGVVRDLLERPLRRLDVVELVRGRSAAPAVVAAAALADRLPEESAAEPYFRAAKTALLAPHRAAEEYAIALRQARAATGVAPLVPAYRIAAGGALYRLERYESAVSELTAVEASLPGVPANLAILAMAHARLGHARQARDCLARAERAIETPPWTGRPDAGEVRGLCREAAEVVAAAGR